MKRNFFLFLNDSEKESMIQKLYDFQPFLSQINNHENKLEGFNNILDLSLKSDSKDNKKPFSNIFKIFNDSLLSKEKVEWTNILSSQKNQFFVLFGLSAFFKKNSFRLFTNHLLILSLNKVLVLRWISQGVIN